MHQTRLSAALSYIRLQRECCGVNDYQDFNASTQWNNNRMLTIGGVTSTYTLVTPIACCITTGDFPELSIASEMCSIAPTESTSNYMTVSDHGTSTDGKHEQLHDGE